MVKKLISFQLNIRLYWFNIGGKHKYSFRKWIIHGVLKRIESLSIQKLDSTIVCSNYLREKIIENYKVSSKKVLKLYKGVSIEDHTFRAPSSHIDQLIKILFVKSNYIRGGLFNLIQALASLTQFSFEVSVIGEFGKNAAKIRDFFKLYPTVELAKLGPEPQEEVFRLMHTQDILCIPSIREGLGVANIEGLASGIPVVTTNVGGIPEVMDYGRNGWLAEPNDIKSLARAIEDCITQPEERKRRSKAGRLFVEQNFTSEKMIAGLLNIFEELLTGK